MKLIDREKSGLSRYCPTFAKAFSCLAEGIRERRQKREMLDLVRQRKLEEVTGLLSSPGNCRILGQLVNHRDYLVSTAACWMIRMASEKGNDVVPAMPSLSRRCTTGATSTRA